MKKIFIIWIGWIGVSALARYYSHHWIKVSWVDKNNSILLDSLKSEWIEIFIGHNSDNLTKDTDLVIYSEAIITKPDLSKEDNLYANPELAKAIEFWIKYISYPEALASIVNSKKCIAISGTHGKSTTTSILGKILAFSSINSSVVVGTKVPFFNNSNFHFGEWEYFTIEACEYKRAFLKYLPYITVINNIDLDHLDYYKDLPDYISAFESLQNQTNWFVVLNWEDENCIKLKNSHKKQYWVFSDYYSTPDWEKLFFPDFEMKIPGKHIEFDAKMSFVVAKILWIDEELIMNQIDTFPWIWRRTEVVGNTKNWNILISDYWHHPKEISLTLEAIKGKYIDKKIFTIFQPHQYSRTIELLEDFKKCFNSTDYLVIPNIYFSRDKKEDVEAMSSEKFVRILQEYIPNIQNWINLENTAKIIKDFDLKNPNSLVFVIMWAWDVDDLRNTIL